MAGRNGNVNVNRSGTPTLTLSNEELFRPLTPPNVNANANAPTISVDASWMGTPIKGRNANANANAGAGAPIERNSFPAPIGNAAAPFTSSAVAGWGDELEHDEAPGFALSAARMENAPPAVIEAAEAEQRTIVSLKKMIRRLEASLIKMQDAKNKGAAPNSDEDNDLEDQLAQYKAQLAAVTRERPPPGTYALPNLRRTGSAGKNGGKGYASGPSAGAGTGSSMNLSIRRRGGSRRKSRKTRSRRSKKNRKSRRR
jgi:hypothetical protein